MELRKTLYFLTVLFLLTGLASCSVNKYIPTNKYLLGKSKIQFDDKKQKAIDVNEIRQYIQPKPNKKFFFTKLNLWAFYRSQKHQTWFNKWLNKRIGQKPVYYGSDDVNLNATRIKSYLGDVGYFDAVVSYKTIVNKKEKSVIYSIVPGKPYRYNLVNYQIEDATLIPFFKTLPPGKLIKKETVFNAFKMDEDRNEINDLLRSNGYYYFNRNYIQYVVDTNLQDHRANVKIVVKAIDIPDVEHPGKFIRKPHVRYFVKDVWITPNYSFIDFDRADTVQHLIHFRGDTTGYKYQFIQSPFKRFRLNAFDNAIKIKPGRPYSDKSVQETYSNLFRYRVLRSVNVGFDTIGLKRNPELPIGFLNSRITMQTGKLNSFSVETMGTNSSGNLGVNGSVSYSNRNIFKGGEVFNLSLNGGFEAQKQAAITDTISSNSNALFNTFETGANASVIFPMVLFPFRHVRLTGNSQTSISVGYNYQLRPYYSRSITNADLGYSWEQNSVVQHLFTPLNINFVKVNPSPAFADTLAKETNIRLKEQYSNHMIFGLKYSYIYNSQQVGVNKNFNYFRLDLESSGNLLYGLNHLLGTPKTSDGYYTLFGVRYSQYARFSADFRHYIYIDNEGAVLVLRSYLGAGIPYGNSMEIPYEKGFYAGGANGMRGWYFRMLGPGGYSGNDVYERIGDIKLEGNIELRFPIYKFLKGALFTDAGNIWNYNASSSFPDGQFKWNTFLNQIAFDSGMGIRLDFTYFVIRFDVAAPIVNPAYPIGSRWRLPYLKASDFIGNFGIGYPF
ncbi:MAG: BamA/TamA family outer membrane protein [Bacteroidales bacterium]|nr:BamA/TamA family outer membrane protein [Bacteroidales bacterium]